MLHAQERIRQQHGDRAVVEAELLTAQAVGMAERADLARPTGVAAALINIDDTTHPGLRSAMQKLALLDHFRADIDPVTGDIKCTTTYQVQLIDGTTVERPLTCTWPNSSRDRDPDATMRSVVREWAMGATFAEISSRRNHAPDWAYKQFRRWATRHGSSAAGLGDHQILAARQAVIHSIDPTIISAPPLPAATIAFIAAPYLVGGHVYKSWAMYPHDEDRRILLTLETAGGKADIGALIEASGGSRHRCTLISSNYGRRPPLADIARYRRRKLKPCPHLDCDHEYASHVLYVPETAKWGVICKGCRRVPDLAYGDVVLPEEYLHNWDCADLDTKSRFRQTVLADPPELADEAFAGRIGHLIRILDVRATIGITELGSRRDQADFPPFELLGGIEFWDQRVVAAYARRRPARSHGCDDSWLSPAGAAVVLNVTESRVRRYCAKGLLAHRYNNHLLRINPAVLDRDNVPRGDRLDTISIAEAVRRLGVSRHKIERAIKVFELTQVLDSLGWPRLIIADFDRWAKESAKAVPVVQPHDGKTNAATDELSVSAAAVRLLITSKRLRTLTNNGVVPCRTSDSGWRWYDPEDINQLVQDGMVGAKLLQLGRDARRRK